MRPILVLSLLALAACGADGAPLTPPNPADAPPPDAPIIGPDGNPVVIQGATQPRSAATEAF